MIILARLARREWLWLGSRALEIEVDRTPDLGQPSRLKRIMEYVDTSVDIGQKDLAHASELEKAGFGGFDAVHLACAESGKARCVPDDG